MHRTAQASSRTRRSGLGGARPWLLLQTHIPAHMSATRRMRGRETVTGAATTRLPTTEVSVMVTAVGVALRKAMQGTAVARSAMVAIPSVIGSGSRTAGAPAAATTALGRAGGTRAIVTTGVTHAAEMAATGAGGPRRRRPCLVGQREMCLAKRRQLQLQQRWTMTKMTTCRARHR